MAHFTRSILCWPAAMGLALLTGCNKTESTSTNPPGQEQVAGPEPSGPHAAGMHVFNSQGCTRCHAIGDDANSGKAKKRMGPDLAGVARDPMHTIDWLADYVRDPKSKNKASRMPSFQGKINDEDFRNLVEYLASLK